MARHRRKQTVNREFSSAVVPPLSALASGAAASVEWKLLLAASAGDVGERDLVCAAVLEAELRKSPDWEEVIRLADHHGTASLLYQNLGLLGDGVPSAVRESLRHRYEKNVHKTLFLARELMRILDCLNTQGIEAIPYKGITLSEVYYGDMALRQAGDIDLFIRREDVTRSKSAVRGLGYTPRITIPDEAEEDYIDAGYEWTFDSPAGNSLLELQWALEPRFYAVDFDLNGLFGRAANTTVAGRTVKTLSSEDLLLVLAVHAAKHVWGRLIWLCDIASIVKRGNLNWDWVQEQAREAGIERILHITLLLARQLLRSEIPGAIEGAILKDRTVPAYADEVAMNMARGILYDVEKVSYFRLMMQLRERRADRMRFLTRLTLTPGPGEWEVVRLPKILFPLYRVVRLARLAARFAGR
jgi:hypothetical protein